MCCSSSSHQLPSRDYLASSTAHLIVRSEWPTHLCGTRFKDIPTQTPAAKWLELLKEIAPAVRRAGVTRELGGGPAGIGQWAVIAAAAASLNVELTPINLSVGDGAERTAAELARSASGGLIVPVGSLAWARRNLIISLAARHKLPAIYPYRFFIEAGGLMSYGANLAANYRLTSGYVDRILRGEKPADLPVQAPTKYELVINLKAAKALGLEVPATLLARADEVIE
jgi:putative tryptophan/tyrosine transport system substrate-binding protein